MVVVALYFINRTQYDKRQRELTKNGILTNAYILRKCTSGADGNDYTYYEYDYYVKEHKAYYRGQFPEFRIKNDEHIEINDLISVLYSGNDIHLSYPAHFIYPRNDKYKKEFIK